MTRQHRGCRLPLSRASATTTHWPGTRFSEVAGCRNTALGAIHAQALIDGVTAIVHGPDDDRTAREVEYRAGFKVLVPTFWLNKRGHDLESQVLDAIPQLRAFQKALDLRIIERAFGDHPGFIPKSAVDLLAKLHATAAPS